MAFEDLEVVGKPLPGTFASVSYKRNTGERKPKGDNKPKLIIGVPLAPLVQAKFLAGQKDKEAGLFVLKRGTGEDAGKLRIVRATKGVRVTLLKTTAVWRFGYVPLLGTDAAEKEQVAYRVIQETGGRNPVSVEVDAPAWFKKD